MSEGTSQPTDKPKRPRAAQGTKRTSRNQTQQANAAAPLAAPDTTGSAVPQSLPAPETHAQPAPDEPPIGERWGEFPTTERRTELKQRMEAWEREQDHGNRPGPFAAVTLSGADIYWLAAFMVGAGDVSAGKQRLDEVPPPSLTNLHLEEANLSGAQLQGAILSRAQLKGVILYGAQLQRANLCLAQLAGATLCVAQLQGADLSRTQLQGANLRQAQLEGADLSRTHLERAILYKAQLRRAILSEAQLERANLSEAQLQGANLSGAQLQGANLSEAQLEGATLYEAQLEGANLRQAQLERVILYGAQLEGANLSRTQLQGANLSGAQLQGANLYRTQLEGADLRQAQLQGAILSGAWLKGANLSGARLEGADLSRTQLEGADLSKTQLKGADLRQAHLTRQVDLRWATLDAQTQLTEANLDGTLQVADVAWNGVSLIRLPWGQVPLLGDEALARQTQTREGERKAAPQWLEGYEAAVRAYRQLAIVLRSQGITDAADRFTYRALVMQRKALWLESNLPMTGFTEALAHLKTLTLPQLWKERGRFAPKRWLNSLNQWARLMARWGWQQLRTIHPRLWGNHLWNLPAWRLGLGILLVVLAALLSVAHWWTALLALLITILVVGTFSRKRGRKLLAYLFSGFLAALTGYGFRMSRIVLAYFGLILAFAGTYWWLDLHRHPQSFSFWQAIILSVTAFHGRVFSNPFNLSDPQIVVTAVEAIVGLVIEGVFIAMLTQRFFNR